MSRRPIFVATHPRACSTAFERVFMTCRDTLQTVHEPFGDAWYFGPERLHDRFENDETRRADSGFSKVTYKSIFDQMERENPEGKRLFIKDMIQYWMPPDGLPASIAPSLVSYRRGVGTEDGNRIGDPDALPRTPPSEVRPYPYKTEREEENPTIVPEQLLRRFHFTFLIRHPRSSIPSYFRCTIPPLSKLTGFNNFRSNEAGYAELRIFFDYARKKGIIGSSEADSVRSNDINGVNGTNVSKGANGIQAHAASGVNDAHDSGVDICVIDADDLLDNPYAIIKKYCQCIGEPYDDSMLKWNQEQQEFAKREFEKWKGFHEDAIHSDELKPRQHKKAPKSDEELWAEWVEKYGEDAARLIKQTVDENVEHYEYLKQFAIKV